MTVPARLQAFVEAWKAGRKLTVLTCYDAQMAGLLAEAGADLLLVGDSLGMVVQGMPSTEKVTLEEMVYHTANVARGQHSLPIVADLPAHTYRSVDEALASSRRLVAAGADAVKFEGWFPGLAAALLESGIPVMGHLGLLPQTAREFKVQGKEQDQAEQIYHDARQLAAEGCFSLVLECIPASLAERISSLPLPTIGIGAGPSTSGQVLVINDLLGFSRGRKAKFVPTAYPNLGDAIVSAVKAFKTDVEAAVYPSDKETYH